MILDSAGDVVSRRDFLPFGEEIAPDTTYRTDTLKYGRTDNVRQKFTGYQNDAETGLDFAEARMYENRHGRFTAVDPLLASGKSADPQTFNRYVYVMNNPLVLTDPDGLQAGRSTKPQRVEQKPPSNAEVQLTGTSRSSNEGYQLVIRGFDSIAINQGVVTTTDGQVMKDHGLTVTEKTNGFGIIVRYQLSPGKFPLPDKNAPTTFEEKISDSTLDGKPNPPREGDVSDKPTPGKLVDGAIVFTDWVGTKSETDAGPSQVSEGNQSVTINTTIGGVKDSFEIRTNRIVINPKDRIKIRITDTTPKKQIEEIEN